MLGDIAARMHINAYGRSKGEVYKQVADQLAYRCDLLIVDEAHRYIGKAECLHTLADLLKETSVPQLWTATGDLIRYIGKKVGSYRDPFAQIRSRINHTLDLNAIRASGTALAGPEDIRELAKRKFELKLDAASCRDLAKVADADDEGGLRLVETIIRETRRLLDAGGDVHEAVRRSIDRKAGSLAKRGRIAATMPDESTIDRQEPAKVEVRSKVS